jgi:hypothetical protein
MGFPFIALMMFASLSAAAVRGLSFNISTRNRNRRRSYRSMSATFRLPRAKSQEENRGRRGKVQRMAVFRITAQEEINGTTRLAWGYGELSAATGVSVDSYARAAKIGKLRTVRIGGRVLVPADEVERILREGLDVRRGRPPKPKPPEGNRNSSAAVEARRP